MVLNDEEIVNWLEEVCKEEPFKSAKDLSIILPEEIGYPIRVLGPSEKWKDKEVHFFGSSWAKEPKIYAKMPDLLEDGTPTCYHFIADKIYEASVEVEKHTVRGAPILPKGGCLDLYD